MSAKADFRKAYTHLDDAKALITPHLDPHLYALTFVQLTYLMSTFDLLATEGAIRPVKKPP